MNKFLIVVLLFVAALLVPNFAVADDLSMNSFMSDVLTFIANFGGLPTVGKISAAVLLLIASMKVSFIRGFVWDKLGAFKALVAPLLGVFVGVLSMQPITLPGLAAYFFAGAGAIVLHELFDAIKSMPGIGPVYVSVIEMIQKLLKK